MERDICKQRNWQRINLQNIQTAHAFQLKKNKKSGRRPKCLNRHFSKEYIQMANKHMQQCSTSLIIREEQLKTSVRYPLIMVKMATIKKSTNNKSCKWCGEKGTLLHCLVGNVNWHNQPLWQKQYGVSFKN